MFYNGHLIIHTKGVERDKSLYKAYDSSRHGFEIVPSGEISSHCKIRMRERMYCSL